MVTKNTVKNILVGIWIVLSVFYISYDLFTKFKINIVQKSYISGQTDTINSIINEANKSCDGFKVYSQDKEVVLISTKCLTQKVDENNTK